MDNKITEIIESLDCNLKRELINYSYIKPFVNLLKKTDINNERTLSDIANNYLKNYTNKLWDVKFYASELHFINKVDTPTICTLSSEVENKAKIPASKEPYKDTYVDGFFILNKKFVSERYVFIEYKNLSSPSRFSKLATDFLKYKIITYGNEANTLFAYILFNDKAIYPTIKAKLYPYYYLLNKTISKKEINFDNFQVFIHFNNAPNVALPLLENTYQNIYKINDLIEEVSKLNFEKEYPRLVKEILEDENTYNLKVIKANIIKMNWGK